jgi:sugar phosphate isomerase/epimerase
MVLPRLKAINVQDVAPEKGGGDGPGGKQKFTRVAPGKGVVDWTKLYEILAQAGYTGPITVEVGYPTKEMPNALVRDLQFARKQVQVAWGLAQKT